MKTKIRVDEINVSRFLNECTRNGTAEDVVQALDHQKWAADELQKIEDEQKGLDQSHHWFKQQAD